MPDEQSDKLVRILEEIRDLTKERNEKMESFLQVARQRYDDAQASALAQRRRFLWTLGPLLLLAIGFIAYLAFWVIPSSEQRQMVRQIEETRMMQSNYLSHPR
jgi:hypothetical protein